MGSALSEAQLIRRAGDGDSRAVRALYERYAPRVYAVVRRIAGDDDLAQDYAQEAWIRANETEYLDAFCWEVEDGSVDLRLVTR